MPSKKYIPTIIICVLVVVAAAIMLALIWSKTPVDEETDKAIDQAEEAVKQADEAIGHAGGTIREAADFSNLAMEELNKCESARQQCQSELAELRAEKELAGTVLVSKEDLDKFVEEGNRGAQNLEKTDKLMNKLGADRDHYQAELGKCQEELEKLRGKKVAEHTDAPPTI